MGLLDLFKKKKKEPNLKKISDMISDLEEIKKRHGDLPVAVHGHAEGWLSNIFYTEVVHDYYDGGYIFSVDDPLNNFHQEHWAHSRNADKEYSMPGIFVRIRSDEPDAELVKNSKVIYKSDDTMDGKKLVETLKGDKDENKKDSPH